MGRAAEPVTAIDQALEAQAGLGAGILLLHRHAGEHAPPLDLHLGLGEGGAARDLEEGLEQHLPVRAGDAPREPALVPGQAAAAGLEARGQVGLGARRRALVGQAAGEEGAPLLARGIHARAATQVQAGRGDRRAGTRGHEQDQAAGQLEALAGDLESPSRGGAHAFSSGRLQPTTRRSGTNSLRRVLWTRFAVTAARRSSRSSRRRQSASTAREPTSSARSVTVSAS